MYYIKKKKLNLSNACKSVHRRVLDVFLCLFWKKSEWKQVYRINPDVANFLQTRPMSCCCNKNYYNSLVLLPAGPATSLGFK